MKISDKDILEYIKPFKNKEIILITCDNCEQNFYRVKKDIRDSITKKIFRSFCSRNCLKNKFSDKILNKCKNCDVEIFRTKSQIKGNIFCNHKCSAEYNNKHRNNEKRIFSNQGILNIKNARLLRSENIKEEYNQTPNLCKKCNNIVFYENRKNLYCSRECRKTKNVKKLKKVSICKGVNCNIILEGRKQYCHNCRHDYYEVYKPNCRFQFNLNLYADLIEGIEYLKELGRYSPSNRKNNLSGASFDHMYSIKDGYVNRIDCSIISHPANCRIMPHSENNLKNIDSSITLENLLERIKLFDKMVDSV